ncbi:arylsulfatase A-like enzyme [Arthrobacter stackebrandtii]|uniref:Arylsulfatase A-like enzyme n=1 Tax=Arthrobacter stackebrandtii TaxID=272161 RepID=A0ABS4YSZ9_9MICC|nr:sulfatase-like hydrolase/transferase [Arthrobacter stackebrandtii]MBP2411922.1 arylsulfatase A-like enzyme [Arthrobacter stackebrandtii]
MNILLIMADQFAAHALTRPRPEHAHFSTPNLDRLAASSTVFTEAYTPFPLCVPARSAMVTGKYPHQLGIMSNKLNEAGQGGGTPGPAEPGHGPESLGHWFTAAGYDCAYAGKWHALQASATADDGFDPIHPFGDEGLVESCHAWLGGRGKPSRPVPGGPAKERPFFLVASFDDPHTICEYARSQPMPYGPVPRVAAADSPPLPPNFHKAPYAPEAPGMEQLAAARLYGTAGYGPDEWRQYRQAYAALVARLDQRIGQLLEGIDLAGTAVVFVSDHGDGDASHGWNQKTALHQECIKVPFMVHVPGRPAGVVGEPVAAVLGLLPTLCQIAGIAAPDGLATASALDGDGAPVVVQTSFQDASALPGAGTSGRALIHGDWKYAVYSWGTHREQLHNLAADPGEQRNLAVESSCAPDLEDMRERLLDWALASGDTGFLKRLVLPASAASGLHGEIFHVPY